jgi:dihydrofolate synthase/folylpolyglutamate synthase
MLYQDALKFLYGLTNYERVSMPTYNAETLNLDRMRRLLAVLDNPHERFKSIHVAGTKGKGSTSVMLASVLQHMGLRVGLFTSPHLSTFRERMQVNRQLIPYEVVGMLADKLKEALFETVQQADGTTIDQPRAGLQGVTFFEASTALGFLYFARENVDWAVVEVGLGGRLDSTNVITPQASIITSISFDHTNVLGKTLAEIAREKAGIIKPAVPVVSQNQALEAAQEIEKKAQECATPMTMLGRHWRWTPGATALNKQTFEVKQVSLIRSKNKPFVNDLEGWYEIQLNGKHQIDNATTVIATIDVIRESLRASGVAAGDISARVVRDGLRATQWPARFEVLRADPPVILDGAHNVDSVNKLLITLVELFPGKRWTFVFGCYKDKDADGMLKQLASRASRFIFVQPAHNPRAMPVEQLLELAQKRNLKATGLPNLMDALDAATSGREAVCITGSLSVVGEARTKWAMKTGSALPEAD